VLAQSLSCLVYVSRPRAGIYEYVRDFNWDHCWLVSFCHLDFSLTFVRQSADKFQNNIEICGIYSEIRYMFGCSILVSFYNLVKKSSHTYINTYIYLYKIPLFRTAEPQRTFETHKHTIKSENSLTKPGAKALSKKVLFSVSKTKGRLFWRKNQWDRPWRPGGDHIPWPKIRVFSR